KSRLDRIRELAALPGEIGNALARFLLQVGRKLIFEQILHLRPETAQIGFEGADRLVHLWLHQLPQLSLDATMQFLLTGAGSQDQAEAPPPAQSFAKKFGALF